MPEETDHATPTDKRSPSGAAPSSNSQQPSLASAAIVETLAAIAQRLATLAIEDPSLREQMRGLARLVLEATENRADSEQTPLDRPAAVETRPTAQPQQPAPASPWEPSADRRRPEHPSQPLPKLTLGQTSPPPEPAFNAPAVRWTTPTDAEFPAVEARCRLKAEACRWAARRQRLIADGGRFSTDIEPGDREIIARAKALPDCFLWMCHPPTAPVPSDLELYNVVASCFENQADALSLVKQVLDDPELHQNQFESALDLLAEAQSALRAAVEDIDGPADSDQLRVFNWLRETAAENRIFIQRYMRLDDPADPRQWSELANRIEALDTTLQEAQRKHKSRRKLLGKVRHKASLIAREPQQADEHWRLLMAAVDELITSGLPPSNPELRELILPVMDSLPDVGEIPRTFQLVLREIDRLHATNPVSDAPPRDATPSPQVAEVAELLSGKSAVLIGGERRPSAHQAIEEAFDLSELIWIETREHQSIAGFEANIARPDVAVVLLAIRWSSHSFGEAKEFCDKHAKPLVRLPGGYNPSQIAVQILSQCSERLQAT